jgi:DNA-binding LacI/PurR family transcriptional regulator
MENTSPLLYRRVFNDIIGKIKSGELKPGDKLPTELELANIYAVSRITITRAMKELESMNLIFRIKKSGTFINGKVNRPRPQLIVPMILPFEDKHYFEYVDSAQDHGLLHNCFVPAFNSMQSSKKERDILTSMLDMQIDGLIVYPQPAIENIDIYLAFRTKKIPIVFIDRRQDALKMPLITSDNEAGMYNMVKQLIKMGHRRIAFCAVNDTMIETERQRFAGYCTCLNDHGITVNPDYIYNFHNLHRVGTDSSMRKMRDTFESYLGQAFQSFSEFKQPPTALVCINDTCAKGSIKQCKKYGIRIPEDLSITGFDDIKDSRLTDPPLSTVKQNFPLMGKTAIETALALINDEPIPDIIEVKTELIMRESARSII